MPDVECKDIYLYSGSRTLAWECVLAGEGEGVLVGDGVLVGEEWRKGMIEGRNE